MFIPRTVAVFMLACVAPVDAQTPPADLIQCADSEADTGIGACAAIVRSTGQTDDTLAKAFTYRGFSYLKKTQFDRSIDDFTPAIRLEPNNAWAFANRGNAYFNKGQYDRALQDYDQSLQLNPSVCATLFYGRGQFTPSEARPGVQ